jgi:hypothetical protein
MATTQYEVLATQLGHIPDEDKPHLVDWYHQGDVVDLDADSDYVRRHTTGPRPALVAKADADSWRRQQAANYAAPMPVNNDAPAGFAGDDAPEEEQKAQAEAEKDAVAADKAAQKDQAKTAKDAAAAPKATPPTVK